MHEQEKGRRSIGEYLRELAADQDRLMAYLFDADAHRHNLIGSGLSREDQELLERGDLNELCEALQRETDADVKYHIIIRPIQPPPDDSSDSSESSDSSDSSDSDSSDSDSTDDDDEPR